MSTTAWWRDFRYADGVVTVGKTGAEVPVEPGVVAACLSWLRFHLAVEVERRRVNVDGPRIWFAPDRPRPWYLIWPATQLAGLRIAARPKDADLGFFFEDVTTSAPPSAIGLAIINSGCADVSKSRVAEVFEQVSGRALRVDPETWTGAMVGKSEKNGAHDGRLADGPRPSEGLVWQRFIDTLAPDGCVEDLRCPTVGGEIPVVYLKRRPAARRFENYNSEVRLMDPKAAFTEAERGFIRDFARAMGLDWGGVDVLRDRRDGRLWIVDVNKTDMGPPTALPFKDKLTSVRVIAARLRAYAEARATA